MSDSTEHDAGADQPKTRAELEAIYGGQVWDQAELTRDFHVTAIIGLSVVVRRRVDGQVGTMRFQNDPRFYFGFEPHKGFEDDTDRTDG